MKEIEKSPGSRKVNVVDVLKVNGGDKCLYCTVCLWDDLCHPYREY